jgi:hypothetical protein
MLNKNQPSPIIVQELTAEELAAVAGGRQYNVYSNGGFYSGANVNSFNKRSKRKR